MANYDSSHTGAVIDAAVTKATPTSLGTSEVSKCVTVDASGDLIVPDSDEFKFGTGGDMKLYHDGSNSFIQQSGTGALKIATEDSGKAVSIGHTTSETTVNDNLTVTGNLSVTGTGPGWVLLQSTTASDVATVDMETGIDSTYDVYMIVGHDIRGSMDNAAFSSRFEISTYKSDAYYSMTCNAVKAGTGTFSNTGTANDGDKLRLADAVGNASTECTDFVMYLHEPHGSGQHKGAYGHARFTGTDGYHWSSFFGGTYINSTAAVTGVQFFFDLANAESETVAAGVFALYGLSK